MAQKRTGHAYGRTTVDFISVVGSLSDACQLLEFVMLVIKRIGVSVRDKDRG